MLTNPKSVAGPSSFTELALDHSLKHALDSLGYETMTEIQAMAVQPILAGRDVLARSKTGSGKTIAFGIGLLSQLIASHGVGKVTRSSEVTGSSDPVRTQLDRSFAWPQALVLAPTRELAEQVAAELRRLGQFVTDLRIVTLCGGVPAARQRERLQSGAHIVVGTPGRILDLLAAEPTFVSKLKTLVLDEADRMLDMGFEDAIAAVVAALPRNRQTLLFSATYPEEIESISRSVQKDPLLIQAEAFVSEEAINEVFLEIEPQQREHVLAEMLQARSPASALVFCATKAGCNALAAALHDRNIAVLALHSDLDQCARTEVLARFSNRSCVVLVATDIAARGLDVKDIGLVVNFDLAIDSEVHIHRIGRTGRASSVGEVWSFYTQKQSKRLPALAAALKRPLKKIAAAEFLETLQSQHPQRTQSDAASSAKEAAPSKVGPKYSEMMTLSIGGGRKSKLRRGDILGALTKDVGLDPSDIGKIDIFDTYSYVAISRAQLKTHLGPIMAVRFKGNRYKVKALDSSVGEMLESSTQRRRYTRPGFKASET
jgi:ATP-independent RNA helicase DbpA